VVEGPHGVVDASHPKVDKQQLVGIRIDEYVAAPGFRGGGCRRLGAARPTRPAAAGTSGA